MRSSEPYLIDELLCTDKAGGCYLLLLLFLCPLLLPPLRERSLVRQEGQGQGLAEKDGAVPICLWMDGCVWGGKRWVGGGCGGRRGG